MFLIIIIASWYHCVCLPSLNTIEQYSMHSSVKVPRSYCGCFKFSFIRMFLHFPFILVCSRVFHVFYILSLESGFLWLICTAEIEMHNFINPLKIPHQWYPVQPYYFVWQWSFDIPVLCRIQSHHSSKYNVGCSSGGMSARPILPRTLKFIKPCSNNLWCCGIFPEAYAELRLPLLHEQPPTIMSMGSPVEMGLDVQADPSCSHR